ncbi:MAG: glycosyltransferase family 1 protein [Gammaproteobacteria bacterium]|nr:glycosyltransferase family 1 protein [Gammaproteobacteria bacterium]MBU1415033.1 glycosyltransferase family 1 protein [Gammaproteobacteria bacterium]
MFIGGSVLANKLRHYARRKRAERLRATAMAWPFPADAKARLLLISQPERIPQSQIFPFHHYASDLRLLYGAEVREADVWDVLAGAEVAAKEATVVAFQTPFDISDADLHRLIDRIHINHPGARIACLDWFAPTDLRNAERMDPLVDVYIKKHLLRDRSAYDKARLGDTNLTDYFDRRYCIDEPEHRFPIPPGFFDKLLLGPSFLTAPLILPTLLESPPPAGPRPIDLHTRFAVDGTPWYQAMRGEAEAALDRLDGLTMVREGTASLSRFMAEMRRSKICFSPFGYGEVCWRDYEAVTNGAVLLKPDMGHVETAPDIFVPWETYVPIRWDLDDFEETVRRLCADERLRTRIARQSFAVLHDWLKSDNFARTMAPLFA